MSRDKQGAPRLEDTRALRCPVCGTQTRPGAMTVRLHRGTLVCWILAMGAGIAAHFFSVYRLHGWGAFGRGGIVIAALALFLGIGRAFPKVRVLYCPTCKQRRKTTVGRGVLYRLMNP